MPRIFYWKTSVIDSAPLTGATSYNFFEHTDDNEPSVTKLIEKQAVEWIVRNGFIVDSFFPEFFPAGTRPEYRLNIIDPFTRPHLNPGDIDLLLINPGNPSQTAAFECKRLKIITQPDGKLKINGAKQLADAVHQVNAYRNLQFHQTYFLIILLDDGRHHSAPNEMFHYATGREIDEILNMPWVNELHEDIGVIFLRILQMNGKHIDHAHSIGYFIAKPAARREQPFDTTDKVQKVLKH